MMQCVVHDPHVQLLWAPLWTAPGFPSECPAGYPSWGRSRSSLHDQGLGGIPDHLPLGDVLGGHHTGPLYEEGYRVP